MENREQGFDQKSLFEGLFKTATDMMLSASQLYTGSMDSSSKSSENFADLNLMELFNSMAKTGEAVFSAWRDNNSAYEALNELNKLSEATLKMARSGMENYFSMQQEILKGLGQAGDSIESLQIDASKDNPFRAFLTDYESFFSKYLNMPKLGLLRNYEEKRDKAVDKYNFMLASVGEVFYLLYMPLARSIQLLQKKFEEMSNNGELPENPKDYYKMWINILEGDYMKLLQSEEFLNTAHRALNAFEDFNYEAQNLSSDILEYLPVPSQREFDELAYENYQMKKQIKKLSKKVDNLQSEQGRVDS